MSKSFVVMITGASSGIGAKLAKQFASAGYHIAMLARNKKAMTDMAIPNSLCLSVDVTDYDAVKIAVQKIEKQLGPIDCLINNAGFVEGGEFTDVDIDSHQKTIAINVQGVINCIDAVLPHMRIRQTGTIINISSVADRHPRPNLATYAASKAAVKHLTESLRMANAAYGIRFCNLAPAKVKTPMLIKANITHPNQSIEDHHIADTALWVYQQPQLVCVRDMVVAPTYYEA